MIHLGLDDALSPVTRLPSPGLRVRVRPAPDQYFVLSSQSPFRDNHSIHLLNLFIDSREQTCLPKVCYWSLSTASKEETTLSMVQ